MFIDAFSVILFDMNGTFMFGHDRFGPEEDYFATYTALGGEHLDREKLVAIMDATIVELLTLYNDAGRVDDFPSLEEAFRDFGGAPAEELPYLERVFAVHEIGFVPGAHAAVLERLATTHKLGLVSNLCSRTALWIPGFRQSSIFDLFDALVFSSDCRSIKPSAQLFQRAVDAFPAHARVLFVGDSLDRDIIPAKSLGMGTVWIAPEGSTHASADRVIASMTELPFLDATS